MKTYTLTEEHRAQLKPWADKWIANAMSTTPMDDVDRAAMRVAVRGLYEAARLEPPPDHRIVFVPSPFVLRLAGGFAAAIWYLRSKSNDATYAATHAATDAATRAATDAATYDATYAATDAATYAATYAATDAATRDATELPKNWAYECAKSISGNSKMAAFMVQCSTRWFNSYQGGNMWAAWDCYLTAGRDVLGLKLPAHEKYAAWEQCAIHGGFRVLHEDFCIVSDFPAVLKKDEQNRPHCIDGPSHQWRDGWSLYHVHGVRIPDEQRHIVLAPHTITVDEIEHEQNAEIRRVMMEQYGYERYIRDCNAQVVHTMPVDYDIVGLRDARLLVKQVPEDEPIVFIDLLNSTPEPDGSVRRYLMRVDPNAYNGDTMRHCQAAAASTWRDELNGALTFKRWQDYNPVFES